MSESEGTISTKELGVLTIASGISEEQIAQLIDYSNEDLDVIKNTDDQRRFKDRNAFNEWLKKGRKFFTLVDKEKKLLGIIWYGRKDIPQRPEYTERIDISKYNYTLAIRLYWKARGKHLAEKFMRITFDFFMKSPPDDFKGLWLETSTGNVSAVKAYRSFGYKDASTSSQEGRILMVRVN